MSMVDPQKVLEVHNLGTPDLEQADDGYGII